MYKKLVLTHANCVDGCCARAIFEDIYKDNAEYIAMDHVDFDPKYPEAYQAFSEKVKDVHDTEVIMADICLPPIWIDWFLSKNNKVTILDHHNTAIKYVEVFEKRMKEGEKINIDITFSKDNSESGSMLAWKHVHKDQAPPAVVNYVSDGDIWAFKHKETKGFYTGLLDNNQPKDYPAQFWLDLLNKPQMVEDIVAEGTPKYEQFMKEVNSYVEHAVPVTLRGRTGLMVFAPSEYKSELGNLLAVKSGTYGLVMEEKPDSVRASLRSVAPYVVSDIAQAFEGGGHQQACAFRVPTMQDFQNLLNNEGNNINVLKSPKPRI